MKKLVYSLAVLFSVALVSCGGNKAADADTAIDSSVEETISVTEVSDSIVADSTAAPAADSAAADSAK